MQNYNAIIQYNMTNIYYGIKLFGKQWIKVFCTDWTSHVNSLELQSSYFVKAYIMHRAISTKAWEQAILCRYFVQSFVCGVLTDAFYTIIRLKITPCLHTGTIEKTHKNRTVYIMSNIRTYRKDLLSLKSWGFWLKITCRR